MLRSIMLVRLFYMLLQFHVLFAVKNAEDIAKSDTIYVFGDSNFVTSPRSDSWMKAGYMPYGASCRFLSEYQNRFSNGKTIPELIAEGLQNKGLENFASASAGILPETGTAFGKNLCFKEQIRSFEEYVEKDLKGRYQAEVLSKYLSESIFLINIGSSDYIHNYLQPNYYNTSHRYNAYEFSELLVNEYDGYLKELHKLGARKMIIFQIGPLGCFPYIIEKLKPRSRCAENINELVSRFNDKLDAKLKELRNGLEGSQFMTARVFSLLQNMIETPADYGFDETRWSCCPVQTNGTGLCKAPELRVGAPSENLPGPVMEWVSGELWSCNEIPMPKSLKKAWKWTGPNINYPCLDKIGYVFFDELHLTQAANKIIVERCLARTGDTCSPRLPDV